VGCCWLRCSHCQGKERPGRSRGLWGRDLAGRITRRGIELRESIERLVWNALLAQYWRIAPK